MKRILLVLSISRSAGRGVPVWAISSVFMSTVSQVRNLGRVGDPMR
jgi:hypothetical protein